MTTFASHAKAQFWSSKNDISSSDASIKSSKKYWFDCNTCTHSFLKKITHIIQNSWCPYCANQKLCEDEDCNTCFLKSFASHNKSIYWSRKNTLNPREVFKNSGKKAMFTCSKCDHQYTVRVSDASLYGCPYCSMPSRVLCDMYDCESCFQKSFASHEKSQYWSSKNEVSPRQVFKTTNIKYVFVCENNHEFECTLGHVSFGRWCPFCKKKTESKLYKWLKSTYPDDVIKREISFHWSIRKRYDFLLENLKVLIELDGPQHFRQISNWQTPEDAKTNDELKNKLARDNGYRLIRICQETVLYDQHDWGNKLVNCIGNNKLINFIGLVYECVS